MSRDRSGRHTFWAVIVTLVSAYFGLYAVMQARYELHLNRATFERAAFFDLVASGNRGMFNTAMKNFGPIQTMLVPPEPQLWAPWKIRDWWGKASPPNLEWLHNWAKDFLALCTPQLCGKPGIKTSEIQYKGYPGNRDKFVKEYRINLYNANIRLATLSLTDLSRADLSFSNMAEARLHDINLRHANLDYANLDYADLDYADLRFANLTNARLESVKLKHADLSSANLAGANLAGANLTDANLESANLKRISLRNANLNKVNLNKADLLCADLSGTNLSDANLTDTNLTDIRWDDQTRWPEDFTPPPSRPRPKHTTRKQPTPFDCY